MRSTSRNFILIVCILCIATLGAQDSDPSILTLERIFDSGEFNAERFGPARWLEDGSGYTTLEASKEILVRSDNVVKYNSKTGKRTVLVPAEKLIPKGGDAPLDIDDYTWSPDASELLIFTNTKRVWRRNTRGDYWVLDLDTWDLTQLGGDMPASTLMFAKFSPDGEKAGYVYRNNIYLEDIETGRITQLTHDGSNTIINGTFDWVYEEELSLRDGFQFSPDGKRIAFWQLDAEGVGEFYMINNTDSIYSKIIPVQYPKVGTTNSACRAGIIDISSGTIRWFDIPGDPRNNYIARIAWAESPDEVLIQHLNRRQNTIRVMLGDARTGEIKTVFTDEDEAWVQVCDDAVWTKGGAHFTWISERDGWRHIYLISRSGEDVRLITKGEYDVIGIECIDMEGGWIYFMASPENATQRYLYRIHLEGQDGPERLTPASQPGTHRYQVSPNARWAIHTYSAFGNPGYTDLIRLPGHRRMRMLVENTDLKTNLEKLKKGPAGFFRVDIGGGVELDGWMMKPHDFDETKQYPVLFHVYSEPAGATAVDRWGGGTYLWHLMLTQKGYIVASVDNRGTPAPRGRQWRKSIHSRIGILNAGDQAAAVRAIRKWPYVDAGRIGVWGWSGGGSATLNALFQYPDLYHTGMSVAPVPDQRLYDTIYQERYMGLPDENPEGFEKGSPISHAHKLEGNLLIVHGTGDDNVHYQGTEMLINELIRHGKHFTMMAYPNRTHGIREGEGTTLHLRKLLTRYLLENMPPDD